MRIYESFCKASIIMNREMRDERKQSVDSCSYHTLFVAILEVTKKEKKKRDFCYSLCMNRMENE